MPNETTRIHDRGCRPAPHESVERRRERGAALATVGLLGAFVIVASLLMSGLTQRVIDHSRAQSAADAAALAGVAEGEPAAAAVAAANDAVLVRFDVGENEVRVEVRTSAGSVAGARAERRLGAFDGG